MIVCALLTLIYVGGLKAAPYILPQFLLEG